jgi:hypothetical protein
MSRRRLSKSEVALTEGPDALLQFLEAGVVVRRQHFALDDRRVRLDLVQPAGMHGRVHDDHARTTVSKFFGGALAAMR